MRNKRLIKDGDGWKTVSRKTLFQNDYLQVCDERVRTPSRDKAMAWTVCHRKSAAVIVPMTRDGRMIMIRQERIPVRKLLWEFPAGQVDETFSPNPEQIAKTAARELREESGWQLAKGGRLTSLGTFYTSPGFTSEHGWLFLAEPVEPSPDGHAHDASETILEARAFTPVQIRRMIARSEICDANSLACYARLSAKGLV
jgi:ADP-ribose pyrophosphatase